ncbi:MAG: hypothetical protein KDK33_19460, partial [Leptospiraceae bacterium]|nr:hypothetical protein [Leptospiraceae bacterium]
MNYRYCIQAGQFKEKKAARLQTMGLRNRGRQFLIHPIYNLASAAITIAGILLILWPAVFDIRLSSEGF